MTRFNLLSSIFTIPTLYEVFIIDNYYFQVTITSGNYYCNYLIIFYS